MQVSEYSTAVVRRAQRHYTTLVLMKTYSDEELVRLSAEGSREALETLVARYLQRIYSFAYARVRSREAAEDIAQDVFVKVWRNLHRFDQARLFRPWLYEIARNTVLDALKKKSALPFAHFAAADGTNWLEQTLVDESQQLEGTADQALVRDKLAAAVGQLAPKYAEVVSLHHTKGLRFREIAESLREPLNTIKSRYRRAVLALKGIIKP